MPITVESGGENWVITPAPALAGEAPPSSIYQQQWMITLTGVAVLSDNGTEGVQGTLADAWSGATVNILPNTNDIMQHVPVPPPAFGYTYVGLSVSQWAPYAAISSAFHDGTDDAGFAVDHWQPTPFADGGRDGLGSVLDSIFQGVDVDISVRSNMAWILKVSYHVTLVGKVAYVGPGL